MPRLTLHLSRAETNSSEKPLMLFDVIPLLPGRLRIHLHGRQIP